MATSAKVLADSITEQKSRITTFLLTYPRYIHSEMLTHRMFSRNASSSRAVPIRKVIAQVISDPAVPIHFGANQSGMSAHKSLSGIKLYLAKKCWLAARWPAIFFAFCMRLVGLHKQIANRILEPWTYITVVVTATDFDNFYKLRCDKENAHPDIYDLAEKMLSAHNASKPITTKYHLPFVSSQELHKLGFAVAVKVSAARCCRVSYLNHDKTVSDTTNDIKLYEKLLLNGHMSPLEHQAIAYKPGIRSGNFNGWIQFRKTINGEGVSTFNRLLKKY